MDYRSVRRQASDLRRKGQGVLLVFLLVFYALKNYVLLPGAGWLWNLALSTTPQRFITDHNLLVLLKCPQCALAGLFIVAVCCALTAWELSGVLLCLEEIRQGKAVGVLPLFRRSLKNIARLARPRNWLFFVYVMLIMPFIDLYSASGMLDAFAIPEYISDFIMVSLPLKCLFFTAVLALMLLCVRWFYGIQGVLIGQKDFKAACRESARLIKGRWIRQLLDILLYTLLQAALICAVPLIAAAVIGLIEIALLGSHASFALCGRYAALKIFEPFFEAMLSVFLRMAVSAYLVVNYRAAQRTNGIEEASPARDDRSARGRTRSYGFLRPLALGLTVLIPAAACPILTFSVEADPTMVSMFQTSTKIAAHKGYSSQAPENTLSAFEKAVECGKADYIELDIRESKDGIPVVIHNANIYDATGTDCLVYDLDYETIRGLTASYRFSASEFPDAYIPTLEETLAEYGNKIDLIIEIKASDRTPDLPRKIVELINKYGCKEHCQIHSGSYEALEAVKAIDDTIPCGLIVAIGTGAYYDLPCADFFSVEHSFVNETMISAIHRLGKQVYVWTVNEENTIASLADLDVDVIITDYPETVYESYHSFDQLAQAFLASIVPDELLALPKTDPEGY